MECNEIPFPAHDDTDKPRAPMEACAICPHQNDCSKVGACLNDLNAHWIALRQSPRFMTPSQVNAVMEALRRGQTVRRFTNSGKKLEPTIVTPTKFKKHCAAYPEWAIEAKRLATANAKAAEARKGQFRRDLTHCEKGHPLGTARIYFDSDRPQYRHRKCMICQRRRDENPVPPNDEQVRRVTAALNAGKTISQICWGRIGKQKTEERILSFRKLKLYRQLNPDFDRFVLATTADNNSKGQQRRYNSNKARIEVIRTEINDYYKIRAMIPSTFPDRDDIVSRIFESLLDGSLRPDAVASRIKQYITDHNRMFPTKFAKFGDSPLVSLDEVMFEDGSKTRGDTVSRGLWD